MRPAPRARPTRDLPAGGAYLGTIIDDSWWRRYRRDGLFMRGNGEWWIEDGTLYFRRYLTRGPLRLDLAAVTDWSVGGWHAGRWAIGERVAKLGWERHGLRLSSGFVVARDRAGTEAFLALLRNSRA